MLQNYAIFLQNLRNSAHFECAHGAAVDAAVGHGGGGCGGGGAVAQGWGRGWGRGGAGVGAGVGAVKRLPLSISFVARTLCSPVRMSDAAAGQQSDEDDHIILPVRLTRPKL